MTATPRIARRLRVPAAAIALGGAALLTGGCSDAEAGAFLGAGIGALAGQAIGNNTEGTLIGTAVGGAVGYGLGNESDKRKASYRYDRRTYDY